jgi:hypothetical protein
MAATSEQVSIASSRCPQSHPQNQQDIDFEGVVDEGAEYG